MQPSDRRAQASDQRPDTVLGKVMLVLGAFGADDHGLTFTELQQRTALAKGTLHRVATDLVDVGLLDRTGTRYHLGSGLFQLGMRAARERGLLEVATPFMEDLYEATHETVHLGIREGREVVYVAKVGGHRQAKSPSRIGGRMPLSATAIGKALLAHAPLDVRREVLADLPRLTPRTLTSPRLLRQQLEKALHGGVAYEYEESAIGIVCVAAPIIDGSDTAVAAISVAGPITRFRPAQHASAVHAAAAGIGAVLARR